MQHNRASSCTSTHKQQYLGSSHDPKTTTPLNPKPFFVPSLLLLLFFPSSKISLAYVCLSLDFLLLPCHHHQPSFVADYLENFWFVSYWHCSFHEYSFVPVPILLADPCPQRSSTKEMPHPTSAPIQDDDGGGRFRFQKKQKDCNCCCCCSNRWEALLASCHGPCSLNPESPLVCATAIFLLQM